MKKVLTLMKSSGFINDDLEYYFHIYLRDWLIELRSNVLVTVPLVKANITKFVNVLNAEASYPHDVVDETQKAILEKLIGFGEMIEELDFSTFDAYTLEQAISIFSKDITKEIISVFFEKKSTVTFKDMLLIEMQDVLSIAETISPFEKINVTTFQFP